MVVDLPRRWRWVIGAGCAVVLGLTAWLLAAEQAVEPDPAEAFVPRRAAAAPPEAPVVPAAPEAVGAALLPTVTRSADEIEVCGGGWMKLPDANATPAQMEAARAEFERSTQLPQRRAEVLAALHATPGELVAAAAGLVEANIAREAGDPAGAEAARATLLRIALSTRDPKVYALAFKACNPIPGLLQHEGACRMVSAQQWSRLDPDNAAPWLFILGNENASGKQPADIALRDEALHRIATAARNDGYFHASASALVDAAPAGEASRLAVHELASQLVGIEAAVAIPGYQDLSSACRGDALNNANRAQACADVAELLAERSASLMDRTIGIGIGTRMGWPVERIDRLRGEQLAYMASMNPAPGDEADFSCARLARDLDGIRRHARLGESGAMRAWIAGSGRKPEDFIREQRARQRASEAMGAAVARGEAASTASAGSAAVTASAASAGVATAVSAMSR